MIIISCDLAENDSTNNATAKEIEVIELVEIYLNNFLDEPRGFCLDIKGYKSSASVERGLQAHTCYSYQGEVAVDQGFDFARLANQEFYLPNFDICMQAENDQETAELILRSCDKSTLQQFVLRDDGKIYADKLRADGNDVTYRCAKLMIQGVLRARALGPGGRAEFKAVIDWLNEKLT